MWKLLCKAVGLSYWKHHPTLESLQHTYHLCHSYHRSLFNFGSYRGKVLSTIGVDLGFYGVFVTQLAHAVLYPAKVISDEGITPVGTSHTHGGRSARSPANLNSVRLSNLCHKNGCNRYIAKRGSLAVAWLRYGQIYGSQQRYLSEPHMPSSSPLASKITGNPVS